MPWWGSLGFLAGTVVPSSNGRSVVWPGMLAASVRQPARTSSSRLASAARACSSWARSVASFSAWSTSEQGGTPDVPGTVEHFLPRSAWETYRAVVALELRNSRDWESISIIYVWMTPFEVHAAHNLGEAFTDRMKRGTSAGWRGKHFAWPWFLASRSGCSTVR